MKVFIYCGVSGAGKSTLIGKRHPTAKVLSADSFFMVDGEYCFDPTKLGAAHAQCLRDFVSAVQFGGHEIVVVDNTNTTIAELAPYAAVALAYGHDMEIVTVLCAPGIAAERNVHDVPVDVIVRMHEQLMKREMPPWWKHSLVGLP